MSYSLKAHARAHDPAETLEYAAGYWSEQRAKLPTSFDDLNWSRYVEVAAERVRLDTLIDYASTIANALQTDHERYGTPDYWIDSLRRDMEDMATRLFTAPAVPLARAAE